MMKTTTTSGCLTLGLLFATNVEADPAAIEKGKKALAAEAERYNLETKYTFAREVDWKSVPDLKEAESWGERCGYFMTEIRSLCTLRISGPVVPACTASINAELKTLHCVAVTDAARERVERKGATLLYYMAEGMNGDAREKVPKTLVAAFPKAAAIMAKARKAE